MPASCRVPDLAEWEYCVQHAACAGGGPMQQPVIELWFDFGSNYSYLSVMRIGREAERRGVALAWKPFMLGPILRELGWSDSPFVVQETKGRYVWRDMERQCAKFGLPWNRPRTFPRRAVLPHRVALWGESEAWIADFCRTVMMRNFVEDRDIDSDQAMFQVLGALGLPPEPIIEAARSPANKERLREQTDEARARGVFGAPTFFVGDEMFWGNDRMDDALELASRAG